MNRMCRGVLIAVGISFLSGLYGCSKSPESEYESLIRSTMKDADAPAAAVEEHIKTVLADFKKMSVEEQKKELEKTKAFMEGLKEELKKDK